MDSLDAVRVIIVTAMVILMLAGAGCGLYALGRHEICQQLTPDARAAIWDCRGM